MSLAKKLGRMSALGALVLGLEGKAQVVAHWDFNEGSGLNVYDSIGNNTGTLQGGVNWTTDSISETALEFNGGQVRIVGSESSLDFGTKLTIEAYAKRMSVGDGLIIGKNSAYVFGIKNDKLFGALNTGGNGIEVNGNTILQEGEWYKLRMAYDGLEFKVYVNDIEDGNFRNSSPLRINRSALRDVFFSGSDEISHPIFYGMIDDVKISSGAYFVQGEIPEPSVYGIAFGLMALGAGMALKKKKEE